MQESISYWKVGATAGGAALTAAAVWLNAEHIAEAEGWSSPLVLAGALATVCAALTPPVAERCAKQGEWLKAAGLWLFFGLVVAFSLSTSIGRAGGHRDGQVSAGEASNIRAQLAREAYAAAQRTVESECAKRGPRCRAAEAAVTEARAVLGEAAPVKPADPAAERLAAVLGLPQEKVALLAPLLLPLGLELGGFLFLAVGLSPRRREIVAKDKYSLERSHKPQEAEEAVPATTLAATSVSRPHGLAVAAVESKPVRMRDERGRFVKRGPKLVAVR
jgi:hypothetical protein